LALPIKHQEQSSKFYKQAKNSLLYSSNYTHGTPPYNNNVRPNTTNNNPYVPKTQTQTQDLRPKRFLSKDEFEDRSKCYNCQGRGHLARECPNKRTLTLNEFVAYEQEENLYDVMMKLENAQGEEKVEDVIDVYGEDDDCDDVSKDMTRVMHMLHVDIENEHKGLNGQTILSQELEVVQCVDEKKNENIMTLDPYEIFDSLTWENEEKRKKLQDFHDVLVQNSSKEISSKVVIAYVFDCINQPTFHYEHDLRSPVVNLKDKKRATKVMMGVFAHHDSLLSMVLVKIFCFDRP